MTIEARLVLLLKYIVWLAIFFAIMMPAQFIWLLLYPFISLIKKKQESKTGVYIDINAWTPMEWYMRVSKRALGINE